MKKRRKKTNQQVRVVWHLFIYVCFLDELKYIFVLLVCFVLSMFIFTAFIGVCVFFCVYTIGGARWNRWLVISQSFNHWDQPATAEYWICHSALLSARRQWRSTLPSYSQTCSCSQACSHFFSNVYTFTNLDVFVLGVIKYR